MSLSATLPPTKRLNTFHYYGLSVAGASHARPCARSSVIRQWFRKPWPMFPSMMQSSTRAVPLASIPFVSDVGLLALADLRIQSQQRRDVRCHDEGARVTRVELHPRDASWGHDARVESQRQPLGVAHATHVDFAARPDACRQAAGALDDQLAMRRIDRHRSICEQVEAEGTVERRGTWREEGHEVEHAEGRHRLPASSDIDRDAVAAHEVQAVAAHAKAGDPTPRRSRSPRRTQASRTRCLRRCRTGTGPRGLPPRHGRMRSIRSSARA